MFNFPVHSRIQYSELWSQPACCLLEWPDRQDNSGCTKWPKEATVGGVLEVEQDILRALYAEAWGRLEARPGLFFVESL